MSLHHKIRLIKHVDAFVTELRQKYGEHSSASPELRKLSESLDALLKYLTSLDELQPNYTTNETDKYMLAINLNMDILKAELQKSDYNKLSRGVKLIKTLLKFHPAKYSPIEFILVWIYEMIYFI